MTEADTTTSTAPSADAELIRLCEALPALKAAFEADGRDADDNPAWPPYIAACDAISAATPQTMAGIIAKANAAKADGLGHEGVAFTSCAEEWAWDVALAVARLAPEPARA